MDIQLRKQILGRIIAFARRAPITSKNFCVDKKFCTSPDALKKTLLAMISEYIAHNNIMFSDFQKIKIYYDNGQSQIREILSSAFAKFTAEFPVNVTPGKYRLFQVADLICTLHLLKTKVDINLPLTKSETYFFHGTNELKKKYLRPLSRLLT